MNTTACIASATLLIAFVISSPVKGSGASNDQDTSAPPAKAVSPTNKHPGEPIVKVACSACHSLMVIDNASKDLDAWSKTLTKMEQQGMPPMPSSFRDSVLSYLTQNHGPTKVPSRENTGPWGDRRNSNPLWK